MLLTVAGLVLLIVQSTILVPLLRKARSRQGEGVALSGESLWAVAGIGWIVYGYLIGSVTLMISGGLAAVGSGLTWWWLRTAKHTDERHRATASAGVLATVLAGSWVLWGADGVSVALAAFGVGQFLPQAVETARCLRRRVPTPGVSVSAAALRSAYTAGWSAYAFASTPIAWPLAAWGAAGAVVFATQAVVARHGTRTVGEPAVSARVADIG